MFHVCMYEGFLEGEKSENKSYAKIPKCTSICGDQRWKNSKYAINGMLVDQLNIFMGGVTQGRDRIFLGRLEVN